MPPTAAAATAPFTSETRSRALGFAREAQDPSFHLPPPAPVPQSVRPENLAIKWGREGGGGEGPRAVANEPLLTEHFEVLYGFGDGEEREGVGTGGG